MKEPATMVLMTTHVHVSLGIPVTAVRPISMNAHQTRVKILEPVSMKSMAICVNVSLDIMEPTAKTT